MIPRRVSPIARGAIGSVLAIACSASLARGNAKTFPVQVETSNLTPSVLEGVAVTTGVRELQQATWNERVEVVVRRGATTSEVSIASCTALLAEGHRIVDVKPASRWNELRAVRVQCGALHRLDRMKDAAREVLPFDARALLPQLASLRISIGPPGRGPDLQSLRDAENVKCPSRAICTADAGSNAFAISLLARGDYDGDGVADVMIAVTAGPTRGTQTWSSGLVVAKATAEGRAAVLEQW